MFDLDRWEEIWQTISRNRKRSIMTAFGVFWGIFMLTIMLGAGLGLKNALFSQLGDMSVNSCFFWGGRTSIPYKGLPLRKKDHGNAVIARFRERFSRLLRCFFKKSMWNLRHNANAIAGGAVSVLAGAVFKFFDDLQRVIYCPMRSLAADIDNGADTAGIMLAFLFGGSIMMYLFHAFLSPLPL